MRAEGPINPFSYRTLHLTALQLEKYRRLLDREGDATLESGRRIFAVLTG